MGKTKREATPSTPKAIVVSNPPVEEEEVDEEIAIFDHVLRRVLNRDSTSPLYLALVDAGYQNIWDLITMDSDEVATLPSAENTTLRQADRSLLKWFICFYHCHKDTLHLPEEWYQLTKEEFNQFRTQKTPEFKSNYMTKTTPSQMVSGNSKEDDSMPDSKPQPSNYTVPRYSPAELFKKSIKKDPSLFPVLKDDRYHDQWHRTFKTQARSQDLAEVLDSS